MEITRKNWTMLAGEIRIALQPIMVKHGLDLTGIHGTYGSDRGTFKLEIEQTAEASTDGLTRGQRDYLKNCDVFGLMPHWLHAPIYLDALTQSTPTDKYYIDNLNLRAPKFPVNVTSDKNAKRLKVTATHIRRCMEKMGWPLPYSSIDNKGEQNKPLVSDQTAGFATKQGIRHYDALV